MPNTDSLCIEKYKMTHHATLDTIFRRLNWVNKGVNIDGEFLTNLRFAVNIHTNVTDVGGRPDDIVKSVCVC